MKIPWTGDRFRGLLRAVGRQATEFFAGLFLPSTGATLVAIAVVVLLVATCFVLLTPRRIAETAPGYFMASDRDEYALLTVKTLHIVHHPPPGLSVAIIGDSGVREAISSEGELADFISAELGQRVSVHLLVAGGLDHWCAVELTDCLRGNMRGLVVLEISASDLGAHRLAARATLAWRLALDSRAFEHEVKLAKAKDSRTGVYLLDHGRFFVARPEIALNLVRGPFTPRQHLVGDWRPWGDHAWAHGMGPAYAWTSLYPRVHRDNLRVYARIFERLRQSGDMAVALLESPMNPRAMEPPFATEQIMDLLDRYAATVTAFAEGQHVPYWDLNDFSGLQREDFLDYIHVRNPEARRRYTEVLAKHAAAALRELTLTRGAR